MNPYSQTHTATQTITPSLQTHVLETMARGILDAHYPSQESHQKAAGILTAITGELEQRRQEGETIRIWPDVYVPGSDFAVHHAADHLAS